MNTNSQSQVPDRQSLDTLLEVVSRREKDLTAFLPLGVHADRFMALAKRAIHDQPALAECSAGSVLRALRESALSGLELDGNFSTLIVRRPKQGRPVAIWDATFRGMIWQALASGHVRAVDAQVVREHDEFRVELGSGPKLVHVPKLLGQRGSVLAAYAVAEMMNGAKLIELCTAEDIARIRAASPAGERGAWGPWADEMARKSAIRRLLKKLPAGTVRFVGEHAEPASVPRLGEPGMRCVATLQPEEQYALECRALDNLSIASTVAEIDAAWAQARLEFHERGAEVPLGVEARWRELRETQVTTAS